MIKFRDGFYADVRTEDRSHTTISYKAGILEEMRTRVECRAFLRVYDGRMWYYASVTLDANFDETWGDKLELYTLLEHGENKEHTVQIKLVKTSEADASEFYLVSIIASGR